MNKRQWKKYRKRNYCWTYKEYKQGNVYSFIQYTGNKSGKSKALLHNGSKGEPWITRNRRIYDSEFLCKAFAQFNEDVASGKYSNKVFYGELDHPHTQSFEIQPVARLIP